MNNHSYIYKSSNAQDLRLYIIELTIQIEESVSKTLGEILNIDWENSNSFGYKSSALSFNQKIQIIQDLKGLDKVDRKMFTDLMSIRNKFAHVNGIKTFQDFFNLSPSGMSVKKNLDNWYSEKYIAEKNSCKEFKYKVFFNWLFLDIMFILIKKVGKHHRSENLKLKELEDLRALRNEIKKLPNGNEILTKISSRLDGQK